MDNIMDNIMDKRAYLSKDGRLVYVVENTLDDIAFIIDVSNYTLLDWGANVEMAKRYRTAAAKQRTCKTTQTNGPCPSVLLVPLFAIHTTPEERYYAIQRATSDHASDFITELAQHYVTYDNTYIAWLRAEMARSPFTARREVLYFMIFRGVPSLVRHRAPRSQFWGALILYHLAD